MKIHPSRIGEPKFDPWPLEKNSDWMPVILTWLFLVLSLAFTQAGQNVQYDTINGIAIAGGANTITLSKGTTTLTLNTTLTPVPNTLTINGHALTANVTITKGDIGLGNVENTALSTWAGSANLTTGAGGLFGTAAYTASTAYATSAQGTKADAAIQSIATPGVIFTNPVSVTSGAATHNSSSTKPRRNSPPSNPPNEASPRHPLPRARGLPVHA